MGHAATATPPGTWQETAAALYRITAALARRLCAAHAVPAGEVEEVVAESLLSMCTNVERAWARGPRPIDCRYFALAGLASACSRRGKPLPQLHKDAADRAPGPVEELEAAELLPSLLARLPDERLRRIVRLRAEGLAVREVAGRVGLSRQRVEQMLQQARALLAR
jgi:DNA-directed RNA polymerase specialized sigma24 family protein